MLLQIYTRRVALVAPPPPPRRRQIASPCYRRAPPIPHLYRLLVGARQGEVEAQVGRVGRPQLDNLAHVRVVDVRLLWVVVSSGDRSV